MSEKMELNGVSPTAEADLRDISLWYETSLSNKGGVAPCESLMALDGRGADKPRNRFDHIGYQAMAIVARFCFPARHLCKRSKQILQIAEHHRSKNDAELREWMDDLAKDCRLHGLIDRTEASENERMALAALVLVVERVFSFSPHLQQVMGALALLEGRMAEMATGEGKTVTAAMAAAVAAWRGMPCHVVTANDYLAQRDAKLNQQLFNWCGLSVIALTGETAPTARQAAHRHDVVYTTATDLLGDYLRDGLIFGRKPSRATFSLNEASNRMLTNQAVAANGVVMRGIWQVIVDEADSVMIDEAVTPLIISSQREDDFLDRAAVQAVKLANALKAERDYVVQRALRHVELTKQGRENLADLASGLEPFWRNATRVREMVEMALYAIKLMVRDQHYVVEEDKVVLVDELTGRLARQRTLSLGMQQVLEASLDLPISPPTEVSARLSFQRFFRLFKCLAGMTGTAEEASREFMQVYRLSTIGIPTHKPNIRQFYPVCVLDDEDEKFTRIVESTLTLVEAGRAVLIGMRSVKSSEELYQHFGQIHPDRDVNILHAVNHKQESEIVARAGQTGAITIATNMAGRGTDIALAEEVKRKGGLHVIIGESNDFGRIDRQLIGRCARQGNPGSVQRFIALDDTLARRFLPNWLVKFWSVQHKSLPVLDQKIAITILFLAQWRAEKMAFKQRQNILKMDLELDKAGF